jgi:hypothetical protein
LVFKWTMEQGRGIPFPTYRVFPDTRWCWNTPQYAVSASTYPFPDVTTLAVYTMLMNIILNLVYRPNQQLMTTPTTFIGYGSKF